MDSPRGYGEEACEQDCLHFYGGRRDEPIYHPSHAKGREKIGRRQRGVLFVHQARNAHIATVHASTRPATWPRVVWEGLPFERACSCTCTYMYAPRYLYLAVTLRVTL